ncbi:MAG: hypothetical protein Fur0010_02080 [Bdellovibrio sp.]
MCCHLPLTSTLGGSKVYIEAAECYRQKGHEVELVGIDQIVDRDSPFLDDSWRLSAFPTILKNYIEKRLHDFDVIEFEAPYLPIEIERPKNKLLVARSVLLELHLKEIRIPRFKGPRSFLGSIFKAKKRREQLNKKISMILKSIELADVVNVPNPDDKDILIRHHVPENKIIVQPYGIFETRRVALQKAHQSNLQYLPHKIAFVGTFDNRKGAVEFPHIIREIIKKHPEVKFKLMGVIAMFPTEEAIFNYLGKDLKKNVQIVGKFDSNELPYLLNDCTIGIFPSYLESFGFGALEMMAAGMPVIGYSCPGVRSIIPKENLIKRGDFKTLISRLDKLISDNKSYQYCKHHLKGNVDGFIYERQENVAIEYYLKHL